MLGFKKNKKGYTLLEILLSFAIFGILTAIIVFGFRDTSKMEALKQTSLEMVSNLKKMQNWSMTGHLTSGTFPVGGYGVHFTYPALKNRYDLFADRYSVDANLSICELGQANFRYDDEGTYDPRCNDEDIFANGYFFEDNVKIKKIEISGVLDADIDNLDIAFKPPKPMPYVGWRKDKFSRDPDHVNYNSVPGRTVNIYLEYIGKSLCRRITVFSASGQIKEDAVNCP